MTTARARVPHQAGGPWPSAPKLAQPAAVANLGRRSVQSAFRRLLVFRCTHFEWATRSCDSYSSRPGMCRDYPRALLGQASPQFLPGCGYRAVAAGGERLRKALEERRLPPDQLERLKKGLYLDE